MLKKIPLAILVFVSDALALQAATVRTNSTSVNQGLTTLPRVYCKSKISGPLPSVADCLPTLYHISTERRPTLPHIYIPGQPREWDGVFGHAFCRIFIFDGVSVAFISNNEVLERMIWVLGKCFSPGNIDRISEITTTIGSRGDWRLRFEIRLATRTEIQRSRVDRNGSGSDFLQDQR